MIEQAFLAIETPFAELGFEVTRSNVFVSSASAGSLTTSSPSSFVELLYH
jgi:hypothetical protein